MLSRYVPLVAPLWGLSEAALAVIKRRTGGRGTSEDRWSMILLFVSFTAAAVIAIQLRARHLAPIAAGEPLELGATIVLAAGLLLRWWSIVTLGTRFTFDVRIVDDHELVRRGPYRLLRHPSYTGLLMILGALGLAMRDWYAFAAMALIPIAPLAYRIRVEEAALGRAFGKKWDEHVAATWRLIPWIY
jgi:protein-S-isoprenylcysteine O-methyltransferase